MIRQLSVDFAFMPASATISECRSLPWPDVGESHLAGGAAPSQVERLGGSSIDLGPASMFPVQRLIFDERQELLSPLAALHSRALRCRSETLIWPSAFPEHAAADVVRSASRS